MMEKRKIYKKPGMEILSLAAQHLMKISSELPDDPTPAPPRKRDVF